MAQQPSEACCTVPPVVVKDYKEKGKYVHSEGFNIYATGDSKAKHAILVIFDIFGFFPQTLQGADILAATDQHRPYQVFMPDFFHGKPFPVSGFPPDTDEKKKALGEFFAGAGNPAEAKQNAIKIVQGLKKEHPEIEKWGVVGLCWGGKVVSFLSQTDSLFSAAAEVHPAMVDSTDADGITIPIAILASKDEDAKAVKAFEEHLKVPKHVETFGDQIHGWMGARGDLANERVKAEYERGYKTLSEFFHKHL